MKLLVADTPDGRSMAYLLDAKSLITSKGSTQKASSLLQVNFRNLRPISNSHGSLVIMSEDGWRKFAKSMNATFSKESADLIFWSSTGLQS